MSAIRRHMQESFLPLLLVLLGILALTFFVDQRAERIGELATVIRLSPTDGQWDPDQVTEQGGTAPRADAVGDPALVDPAIAEARALSKRGDADAAVALVQKRVKRNSQDPALLNELAVHLMRAGKTELALTWLDRAIATGQASFRAYYNRGLARARSGLPDRARSDYRRALQRQPKHFESAYNLGLLLLREGLAEQAGQQLRAAAALAGGDSRARAYFSLGRALAQAGQLEQAHRAYEKAIEFRPAYLLPRFNQALLYANRQDAAAQKRAEQLLEEILSLRPDFAPAHFLKARLASAAEDLPAALGWYESAARYEPRFWKARYNRGIIALRLGRLGLAQQVFSRLAAEFPDRPEALFNLGRIAYRRQDYGAALDYYQRAMAKSDGNYEEAQINLGLVLSAMGRYPEALRTFDRLIRQDRHSASAVLNRGLVLVRLKRHEQARAAFERAIRLRPDNASAAYNLGKLESSLGRHAEAIRAYERAVRADPAHLKALVNLGIARSNVDDLQGAEQAYRQAIAMAPSYAKAHFNLGLVLRKQGRLQQAVAAYERVIELDDELLTARQNLGVMYAKLAQHELAIRMFHDVLERLPAEVSTRYNLALQYKRLERFEQAETELRRVLRLRPDHVSALSSLSSMLLSLERFGDVVALLGPRAAAGQLTAGQRTTLGKALFAQNELAAARGQLQAALEAKPANTRALSALARVAYEQGDVAEAVALLERASAIRSKSKPIARRLRRYRRQLEARGGESTRERRTSGAGR